MSYGALQCLRESLGLGKVGGAPVEIDHALIFCRLIGLCPRSAQQLSFERSKLVSLTQPDHYREIWKTRQPSHGFGRRSNHSTTSSMRARSVGGTSRLVRLFYSFPNQHVDANPAVRVERKRGSCQGYSITVSFDGSDLLRACPIFIPRDVDRMFDSLSIKLVRAAIGRRSAE